MKISLNLNEKDIEILNKIKDYYKERGIDINTSAAIRYCINTTNVFDPVINKL